jgi:hypothetical protein
METPACKAYSLTWVVRGERNVFSLRLTLGTRCLTVYGAPRQCLWYISGLCILLPSLLETRILTWMMNFSMYFFWYAQKNANYSVGFKNIPIEKYKHPQNNCIIFLCVTTYTRKKYTLIEKYQFFCRFF